MVLARHLQIGDMTCRCARNDIIEHLKICIMETKDFEKVVYLSRVFNVLANRMESCSGDLFIDFPRALDILECGRKPIIFYHKSHADLSERYAGCLRECGKENPTLEDCIKKCQDTLGLDVVFEIGIDGIKVRNINADKYEFKSLCDGLGNVAPKVEIVAR